MLNIEKYEEEIKKQVLEDRDIPCITRELRDGRSGCGECRNCATCSLEMVQWLLQEYREPVVPEEGKAYLSNLLKPYSVNRDTAYVIFNRLSTSESKLTIFAGGGSPLIILYIRHADTMYQLFAKMELRREYSLKELGLC